MSKHLALFDIDGTLLSTSGAGGRAMSRAGVDVFGFEFRTEGVAFAGQLDPLILRDLLQANGIEPSADHVGSLARVYVDTLQSELEASVCEALPGVDAVLDAVHQDADVTLGVLTGNFAQTGVLKLRVCGIDPDRFEVAVWGDASPHDPPMREHLVEVAIQEWTENVGIRESTRVSVIGDTVRDVDCALAHGCRVLGVGTGRGTLDELTARGATRVMDDLSDTAEVVRWLKQLTD